MATPAPEPTAHSRRLAYWLCQLVGWGLLCAFTFVAGRGEMPQPRLVLEVATVLVSGVALTHAFRVLCRPRRWFGRGGLGLMARVLGSGVALGLLHCLVLIVLEVGVYHDQHARFGAFLFYAVLRWMMLFDIWVLLYLGAAVLDQRRQGELDRLRLAEALRAAQLGALQAQLNPHFLFNSLNSLRALIADDPERAQTAVTQLARLLRYSLAAPDEPVTVARELETIDDYLALEALRLGERLRVERQVSDGAAQARIPVMLLQTLVENAIKHGIAELPEGGRVRLSAELDGDELRLTVENPRPQRQAMTERARGRAGGIGLSNATERLRLMFGDSARLELDLSAPDAATARVRLRARA